MTALLIIGIILCGVMAVFDILLIIGAPAKEESAIGMGLLHLLPLILAIVAMSIAL